MSPILVTLQGAVRVARFLPVGWFVLVLVTGHFFEQGTRILEEGKYTPHEPKLVHHGD